MHEQLSERFGRLMSAGLMGVWLVNMDQIDNLDDLLNAQPGAIIRTYDTDAVRFIATDTQQLEGCVAGWISEDEPSKVDESGPSHG